MPEVLDWQRAMVGELYRPIKQPVSIRLDADVLAWFRAKKQYQTTINKALREYMDITLRRAGRNGLNDPPGTSRHRIATACYLFPAPKND